MSVTKTKTYKIEYYEKVILSPDRATSVHGIM